MAVFRITTPDGAVYEVTAPEGTPPEKIKALIPGMTGTTGNARNGGAGAGVQMGLRDPVDAGAQMLRRVVPEGVGRAVDNFGNWLADKGLPVARSTGVAGVDGIVKNVNEQYDADRAAAGREGFDWARLGGAVANPVNLIPASAAFRGATTVPQLARAGAAAGAVGGALQPVVNDTDNFWSQKATQTATGAAAGAVLTPAVSKAGRAGLKTLNSRRPTEVVVVGGGQRLSKGDLDNAVRELLAGQGLRMEDAPRSILEGVRRQINQAVASGMDLDPAMALRKAEAEAIGFTGDAALTRGQMTRNPLQWAQERNLSGVMFDTPQGPQNQLADRFAAQGRAMQGVFDRLGADTMTDRVAGGQVVLDALGTLNQRADNEVGAAYRAFRESTGRDLTIPLQGLAQDYADTLRRFQTVIPAGVRSQFEALGLMGGRQRQVLTIEGAEDLIKTINANTNPADKPAFRALGELRAAVERAITEGADNAASGAGAESAMLAKEARSTAAGVFRTRREVPALQAQLNDVAPDNVVRKFILSADTREVEGLAQLLRQEPQALAEVRSQVAAALKTAAFGTNKAGDKTIAAERFAKMLEAIGPQKLSAIFSPDEVRQLNIAAKVAAQLESVPAGAKNAVNYSNTASGVFNLLQKLGSSQVLRNIPGARSLANQAGEIANERAVQASLQAPSPLTKPPAELTAAQVRALQRLFPAAAVAGGAGFSPR